jgi:hypothetical protein
MKIFEKFSTEIKSKFSIRVSKQDTEEVKEGEEEKAEFVTSKSIFEGEFSMLLDYLMVQKLYPIGAALCHEMKDYKGMLSFLPLISLTEKFSSSPFNAIIVMKEMVRDILMSKANKSLLSCVEYETFLKCL